jgi:hypothetical protein
VGVGGDALGGVDGGGVAEFDRLSHIHTGKGDGSAGAAVDGADPAVGGEARDGPPVTVADPPCAAGKPAVIAASDDQVASTCLVPVREFNQPGRGVAGEPGTSGAVVEVGDLAAGRGQHQRVQTLVVVVLPGGQHPVGQPGGVADSDPVTSRIEVEGVGCSVADVEGCGGSSGSVKRCSWVSRTAPWAALRSWRMPP